MAFKKMCVILNLELLHINVFYNFQFYPFRNLYSRSSLKLEIKYSTHLTKLRLADYTFFVLNFCICISDVIDIFSIVP